MKHLTAITFLFILASGCRPPDNGPSKPKEPVAAESKKTEKSQSAALQTFRDPSSESPDSVSDTLSQDTKEAKEKLVAEKAAVNKKYEKSCGTSPSGRGGPMCKVPAGQFLMGCKTAPGDYCNPQKHPLRKVALAAFYIDQHEVTVADYKKCVLAAKCKTEGLNSPCLNPSVYEEDGQTCTYMEGEKDVPDCTWGNTSKKNHPINCISWQFANDYCIWAGKRLPSEKEWEKAARGENGDRYPWGNAKTNSDVIRANIYNIPTEKAGGHKEDRFTDGYQYTAPVEQFPLGVSPYGVWDMVGNVSEWVSDWYCDDSSDDNPEAEEVAEDETYRITKGGSMSDDLESAEPAYTIPIEAESRVPNVGFRCAWSPDGKENSTAAVVTATPATQATDSDSVVSNSATAAPSER